LSPFAEGDGGKRHNDQQHGVGFRDEVGAELRRPSATTLVSGGNGTPPPDRDLNRADDGDDLGADDLHAHRQQPGHCNATDIKVSDTFRRAFGRDAAGHEPLRLHNDGAAQTANQIALARANQGPTQRSRSTRPRNETITNTASSILTTRSPSRTS
jgi:hypothetical protein